MAKSKDKSEKSPKKVVSSSKGEQRDKLIDKVYDLINYGDAPAYFLDQPELSPSDIVDWISTGDPILDIYVSNRVNGGIPVGRITEVNGLESSGKSLLIGHLLKETQKKGGIAVLIDTEFSVDRNFLAAIGVDLSKMIYVPTNLIENAFQIIENIIETVRKENSDRLITVAVDSVMGATDKNELEGDWEKKGYATQKSIILGRAMRKITETIAKHRIALVFTNQLRSKIGVMFGDPWTTSGGKAIPFHSSLRLRLKMMSKIKIGDKVVGIKTNCGVIKSRLGSMYNSCNFDIYFDRGIDAENTWFEQGKAVGAIIKAKALTDPSLPEGPKNKYKEVKGYFMLSNDPERKRFNASTFADVILTDEKNKEFLLNEIAEKVMLKYSSDKEAINKELIEYGEVGELDDGEDVEKKIKSKE